MRGYVVLLEISTPYYRSAVANHLPAPASESLSHPPETVRFAGLPISNPTWRGEPSPELDAAWTSVTDDVGELPVSREDAVKAGVILDLDTLTEFPERWGGGIYASIEWNHHLHCLNVIRMFARYDHYKDKDTSMKAPHDEIVNHIGMLTFYTAIPTALTTI